MTNAPRYRLGLVAALMACGQATAAPDYKSLSGDWDSNFGPVHIDLVSAKKPAGSARVRGFWMETKTHRGEIESGSYDASTGDLEFDYLETWSKVHGHARLKFDGKGVSGTFKSENGDTGIWTWKRKH